MGNVCADSQIDSEIIEQAVECEKKNVLICEFEINIICKLKLIVGTNNISIRIISIPSIWSINCLFSSSGCWILSLNKRVCTMLSGIDRNCSYGC